MNKIQENQTIMSELLLLVGLINNILETEKGKEIVAGLIEKDTTARKAFTRIMSKKKENNLPFYVIEESNNKVNIRAGIH